MKNPHRNSVENLINRNSSRYSLKKANQGFRYRITQFFCALLIVSILTVSTPASTPRMIVVSAGEFGQDIRFGVLSSNLALTLASWTNAFLLFINAPKTTSKRKSQQIARVEILPAADVTVSQGEAVDFSAVAYTNDGDTVGSLNFEWKAEYLDRSVKMQPMRSGRFKSKLPGNYLITATLENGQQAQAKVTVVENEALRLMKKLMEEKAKGDLTNIEKLKKEGKYKEEEIDSKKQYKPKDKDKESGFFENIYGWLTSGEERPRGPNADDAEAESELSSSATVTASMFRPADEDGWGDNNWWLADDPNNQIGNPPGTSPDAGAGNGNFQFSAPVVALPGRGIDLNLSLHYNSRLWSKAGTQMIYDADKGFPAPGWSLGFGKLMFMGSSGGCMLADADGTKHGYTGTVSNYSSGGTSSTNFNGYSVDGTFIDYSCYYSSSTSGKSLSGTAKLPNGTIITYNSPTLNADQAFPTRITDPQGNYITITYRNNRGPEIQTVTDTLGRVITFNYDASNRLISVDVPQYNGGARAAVRLHYKQITLSPGFNGLTTDTATNTPYVIDAIYYPGTNTGYWFNDADSYSSYGMIAKVVEQRGMNWYGSAGDQGTVYAGTMTKQAAYNYPLSPDYTLTDAPTYTTLTENWAGMDTTAAVTTYQVNFNATPRTVTIIQPNGLKSVQYMYNAPGQWNDGLIYQDETYDTNNAMLSQSVVGWQQGAYNSPRPSQTQVKDEKGQILITDNVYGTNYNQLTSVKEYDYDGTTLLKETKNTYENSANYTGRHIFNLVKTTEVFAGSGTRVARTDYEYDNAPLSDTPNVVMYDRNYDPNTPEWCQTCGQCIDWDPSGYECLIYEGEWISNEDAIYKGNVTKVTSYADAQNLLGAVTETRKYDITGNLISSSSACCELTSLTYEQGTQYAYPTQQTRGSSDPNSPIKNTTSAVYDFNTGLVKQTTDPNGRTSSTTYDAATLRPTTATSSTGAYSQITYEDAAMTVTEEVREYGGALAGKTVKYLNGIGKVVKEQALGANSVWDIVEVKYTNLGQVWKQSRPYRAGETVQWTENLYDILGRTKQITEPNGSVSKAFYNETQKPSSALSLTGSTTRVADAWGRERWGRYDAQGRLVEVVEPDPNGNGSVFNTGNLATRYTYDTLGNLTQTDQGGQYRYFKYDSLGRLTRQKLAEQTATLNDTGTYVGAGAQWAEAFSYDERSNLISKTDARGVKTNFVYADPVTGASDPLNRLREVRYDLSGLRDTSVPVNQAYNTTYEYMTSGDQQRMSSCQMLWK